MTLTEFLLARITKDEADTQKIADPGNQFPIDLIWNGSEYVGLLVSPARVLAECKAKRAIVGRHQQYEGNGICEECRHYDPCDTLRFLAAVYADHPDYREEWKP
jgi:Family of unknown function (DUF6221)